jgi:hypothetical protein
LEILEGEIHMTTLRNQAGCTEPRESIALSSRAPTLFDCDVDTVIGLPADVPNWEPSNRLVCRPRLDMENVPFPVMRMDAAGKLQGFTIRPFNAVSAVAAMDEESSVVLFQDDFEFPRGVHALRITSGFNRSLLRSGPRRDYCAEIK